MHGPLKHKWLAAFIVFGFLSAIHNVINVMHGKVLNYGNYSIFVNSFQHLINHQDLYIGYINEHTDLFKYSPTFALLMGPFYLLPNSIGVMVWDIMNALLLYYALQTIPNLKRINWFLLLTIILAYGSFQSHQTNALIVSIALLFNNCLERKDYKYAGALLSLVTFIKIYGIFIAIMLIFYPQLRVKVVLSFIFSSLVLFLLPLIIVSPHELLTQYQSWGNMMHNDGRFGLSILGSVDALHTLDATKRYIFELLSLLFVITLPITIVTKNRGVNRQTIITTLYFILIWMVIFNHKAEPQTFIIAYIGILGWLFAKDKINILAMLLIVILIVIDLTNYISIISPKFSQHYCLLSVLCCIFWLFIIRDLLKAPRALEQ